MINRKFRAVFAPCLLALFAAGSAGSAFSQDAASAPSSGNVPVPVFAPVAVNTPASAPSAYSVTAADRASCVQSAADMKGPALAIHMRNCLAAKKEEKAAKAKACVAQGGDKTGSAFRAFMKECMAKPAAV